MVRGRDLEQIRVVFHVSLQGIVSQFKLERQVEPREADVHIHNLSLEPGERQLLAGGHLRPEVDLEQGVVARVAARRNGLNHLFEGQFLVRVGAGGGVANPMQQFAEARVATKAQAQREGVGEEPDHRLQLDPRAVGDRAADDDVVGSGAPIENRRERGEGGDVEGRSLGAGELDQLISELSVERQSPVRSEVALNRWPRPIGRKAQQLRCALELAPPVIDQLVKVRPREMRFLPERVIGVLDRDLRELDCPGR